MRICLDIEFQDKIVCILGAGQVAKRKVDQFALANAKIYIYAKTYLPELKTYRCQKNEFEEKLKKADLAIACTNDKQANEAFLKRAKSHHVLCMCAHTTPSQDTFSMVQTQKQDLKLAINTQGAFPKANRVILHQLDPWIDKLQRLKTLRKQLDPIYYDFLLERPVLELDHLIKALEKKSCVLLFSHGSNDLDVSWIDPIQEKCKQDIILPIYLKKQENITYLSILKSKNIKMHGLSLFETKGSYTQKVKSLCSTFSIALIPFSFSYQDYASNYCSHTHPNTDPTSTLISVLPSSYLDQKHPHQKRIILIFEPRFIERILHAINQRT